MGGSPPQTAPEHAGAPLCVCCHSPRAQRRIAISRVCGLTPCSPRGACGPREAPTLARTRRSRSSDVTDHGGRSGEAGHPSRRCLRYHALWRCGFEVVARRSPATRCVQRHWRRSVDPARETRAGQHQCTLETIRRTKTDPKRAHARSTIRAWRTAPPRRARPAGRRRAEERRETDDPPTER